MKVILIEDVKSLGKKGDLVEINEGYARNFILKKNLGLEATNKNLNDLKLKKANEDRIAQEILDEAKEMRKDLETKEVFVSIKVGEGGKIFGSISTKEIAEELTKQTGLIVEKKKMQLASPIKTLGTHEVTVKLHPKVNAKLKVTVKEA
ncbi:MAG TPA: 50S ribosomal protein L9 [Candidatus Merdenecus merdavium]|nr:50S ribosomal protein L9 [Candidatus Merdenecus merdavium]